MAHPLSRPLAKALCSGALLVCATVPSLAWSQDTNGENTIGPDGQSDWVHPTAEEAR